MKQKPLKFLPSTTKNRPWPLPHGFRYLESSHKVFRIHNGRFVPVPLKTPNLLVSDLMYHYYYVTRSQLVPLDFNYNTGQAKPAPERAINLHKPI
jgi:hypothetical protein